MLEHRVDFRQPLLIVFLLNAAEDAVVPKILIHRVIAQGTGIIADGLGILLLINAAKAAQLIKANNVRIALDGLRAVALRPPVVIKIILGYASEVPRLIEIRLGRDGLIEILDGEHIVLIIKGRAPNHDHTINIVLREYRKTSRQEDETEAKPADSLHNLTNSPIAQGIMQCLVFLYSALHVFTFIFLPASSCSRSDNGP